MGLSPSQSSRLQGDELGSVDTEGSGGGLFAVLLIGPIIGGGSHDVLPRFRSDLVGTVGVLHEFRNGGGNINDPFRVRGYPQHCQRPQQQVTVVHGRHAGAELRGRIVLPLRDAGDEQLRGTQTLGAFAHVAAVPVQTARALQDQVDWGDVRHHEIEIDIQRLFRNLSGHNDRAVWPVRAVGAEPVNQIAVDSCAIERQNRECANVTSASSSSVSSCWISW